MAATSPQSRSPPLWYPSIFTSLLILVSSGYLLLLALRDFMTPGRPLSDGSLQAFYNSDIYYQGDSLEGGRSPGGMFKRRMVGCGLMR